MSHSIQDGYHEKRLTSDHKLADWNTLLNTTVDAAQSTSSQRNVCS